LDVQETLRKLKPLIGQKAERFWLAYLSEDRTGKVELETMLGLWSNKLLGNNLDAPVITLPSPPEDLAAGPYSIGNVLYAGKSRFPYGIREDEWVQHTAIFGRSGAGKTNAIFKILDNLLKAGKPFMIFDWKRNYRDLLAITDQDVEVYTPGRDVVPFQFNPLIPPDGTRPEVWLKKLIEIIAHAYYVGEGVMHLFQEAIHAVYNEFKVYSGTQEKYPTFSDVRQYLERQPAKGRRAQWMDSARRTIMSLCFGFMGKIVNTSTQPNIGGLLKRNVILELDALTNADKTLMIESLLLWIHHYRLVQPDREQFKHALIIEEAHHILLKRTGGRGGEAITDTIIREIRELGEAIIIVDQHPSLISIPALGNTYTTITLNLKHRSDVTAIAAVMLLDDSDREIIGRLPIGQAVVKLQGRYVEPFQIKIPLIRVPKGKVTDTLLAQHMAQKKPNLEPTIKEMPSPMTTPKPTLVDKDINFLKDIIEHPYAGVVERYKRLGTSRRNGNRVKERLVDTGIIKPIDIPTRSGKIVLLELTSVGVTALKESGMETKPKTRWGGLEHEYWKHKVAHHYQEQGYQVKLEESGQGFTDIVAEKDGKRIAIEIETGKSDWKKNIEKNIGGGFHSMILVATQPNALQRIRDTVHSSFSGQKVDVQLASNIC